MILPAHRRLLEEHLPYELGMFEWSYAALHDPGFAAFGRHMLIKNLAIESFWTHARNLVEFFNRQRNGAETGNASASDFVKSERFDPPFNFKSLMGRDQYSILAYSIRSAVDLRGKAQQRPNEPHP
jgi:hypothetical protein